MLSIKCPKTRALQGAKSLILSPGAIDQQRNQKALRPLLKCARLSPHATRRPLLIVNTKATTFSMVGFSGKAYLASCWLGNDRVSRPWLDAKGRRTEGIGEGFVSGTAARDRNGCAAGLAFRSFPRSSNAPTMSKRARLRPALCDEVGKLCLARCIKAFHIPVTNYELSVFDHEAPGDPRSVSRPPGAFLSAVQLFIKVRVKKSAILP